MPKARPRTGGADADGNSADIPTSASVHGGMYRARWPWSSPFTNEGAAAEKMFTFWPFFLCTFFLRYFSSLATFLWTSFLHYLSSLPTFLHYFLFSALLRTEPAIFPRTNFRTTRICRSHQFSHWSDSYKNPDTQIDELNMLCPSQDLPIRRLQQTGHVPEPPIDLYPLTKNLWVL
jgi:hypothetical protein